MFIGNAHSHADSNTDVRGEPEKVFRCGERDNSLNNNRPSQITITKQLRLQPQGKNLAHA
jgi:hypothetical protein